MNATRILWGQVIAVFGVTLAGIWAATQWTAHALAYQPELGAPWFWLGPWPIYPPPAFFWWWFAFDAYAPKIFETGALIAVSGAMAGIVIAIAMSVWRAREAKKAETYGSARWASEREVKRVKMLGDDGVVLGRFADRYLRHDGPEHVLCFAPTRSGKGLGLVIPSLLTWPGSCIVHDIKGENWQLTSGFRARHGRVLLFDPTNPASAAYNPLLEVRKGEWEVRDVQNVADVLVDPEGSLEKRNHWEKTSHALLVGAILHVLYAEEDKTLAGVAAFLSDPRRPIETTLRAMMTTPHLGEAGVHPVVASAARELLNKSENERSGVLSTAMSFLGLYRDPIVAKVTRACDWRIADLVDGPLPVSLYLVVPPSDISRTKPLIRLILNQVGRRLTEELNPKGRPHRLLLMLDEFPALGRLDFFESALAFMAGYGYSEILPELDKKVIYLDQFGFSELHKLRARTRREDKHTAFWSKVSDLINEAVLLQQVILPHSNIHHDETIVSPFAEALRDTQEHIGGDISFISTDEIQLDQMEVFAEAFASGAEPSLEFDVDDILDDERNEWLNDIRISVPFDWSGFAPETREQRDKTGFAISELIDRWIAKGMGFDDVLNQELNAYHESRLAGLREAQRRFEKGLENHNLMAMAELFHGSAFRELQYVRELFKEAGVPDGELTARVRAFWDWDGNKEQPNGKILAYMLAALADQFAHGRKKKPSAGFLNDVSAIASYAPYVDAMFVDIECAQLLRRRGQI